MKKGLLLLISHGFFLALGFMLGIYYLPIMIAPDAPDSPSVLAAGENALYTGEFRRDLIGSDRFHWGQGTVFVSPNQIALHGLLAPGPDYKLYLSPQFVDNKADFLKYKATMQRVGDVNTFENFIVRWDEQNQASNINNYNTVVVWCEAFEQFISAAQYRE
jgi:hypothetical protein